MNNDRNQETNEPTDTVATSPDTEPREREVGAVRPAASGGIIARRVIYYIAGVIIALLALRILLLLMAANQGTFFVDLIYGWSSVFAWPFYGIFSYQPAYGQSVFEISSVVAIIVYALIAHGLGMLFTLTGSRRDA